MTEAQADPPPEWRLARHALLAARGAGRRRAAGRGRKTAVAVDAHQQAQTPPEAGPALRPLHRNRDFNLLWSGQAVSGLGSQISIIAYPLLVLAATGSAAKAGIVGGATLVGSLLTLLPAGVIADRYPRRRILVITALAQMVVVGTVCPAVLTHHVYLAHLTVVGLLQGAASAFYIGANRGAIRRVVPPPQLREAFSRTQARDQTAALIGPPAGGLLFGVAQFLPFLCDSVSFGAIAVAAALIRTPLDPVRTDTGPREPVRRRITVGVRYVLDIAYLRTVVIWGAAINAVAAGMLIMVIVLARHHGATSGEVGGLLSVNAACGLVGSLAAPRLTRLVGGRNLALATSWLLPACAVGIAFAPWLWLIAVMGGVTTLTIMPVNILLLSYAVQITPEDLQAQVGNAMELCFSSVSWLGPPVFGALTDRLGSRTAILIAAGLYALAAAWLQVSRELHQLDEQPGAAAQPPGAGQQEGGAGQQEGGAGPVPGAGQEPAVS
jgi:MFS family permease